jgi:hypothetical protein
MKDINIHNWQRKYLVEQTETKYVGSGFYEIKVEKNQNNTITLTQDNGQEIVIGPEDVQQLCKVLSDLDKM